MGSAGVCASTSSCISLESVPPSSSSYFSLIRFAGGFLRNGIAVGWKPRGGISEVLGHDPTLAALVPWPCCSAPPALPRSTAGFQALSSHPLLRANSPWNQGSVFALPVWLVGSAPALIPYHGTWEPKSGAVPRPGAGPWSPSCVPRMAGNFPRESLLPFSSCKADPPRNSPRTACAPPVVLRGCWVVFGSRWGSVARAEQSRAGPTRLWTMNPKHQGCEAGQDRRMAPSELLSPFFGILLGSLHYLQGAEQPDPLGSSAPTPGTLISPPEVFSVLC